MSKTNSGRPAENRFFMHVDKDVLEPPLLADRNVIRPPHTGGDPTGKDRERYRERQKGKAKKKIGDIIGDNPIITRPGKIKIPIEPDKEPIWRPGRDGQGGGGSGKGKPGEQPGDYIEVSWDEFIEMFFDSINLPNMLKKMFAQTMVKTHKRRGVTKFGPRARMNKHETAIARMQRASALRNTRPGDFVDDFQAKCQSVFEAYAFWSASRLGTGSLLPAPVLFLIESEVDEFLTAVESAILSNLVAEPKTYRQNVLAEVTAYLESNGATTAPYTLDNELQQRIEAYVFEKERQGDIIPAAWEVPFANSDLRYNRIEEKEDPDSKAMVGLILDRSGSMSGDPLVIAKAYFFICVLFLKTRYKNVAIVMISHDAQEYLWKTEEEFFKIGAGGGTVAVPAWDLLLRIAQTGATCKQTGASAGPYPASEWNRYMFHATDGQLFDGDDTIRQWWTKIISSPFNYAGYLEISNSWGGFGGWGSGSGWDMAGRALLGLPADVKAHVGMARAESLADVPEAFKQILDKDRRKEA
jgi:uncharacterized sporulation protein YeaH/YhbH (DUF444 family)